VIFEARVKKEYFIRPFF